MSALVAKILVGLGCLAAIPVTLHFIYHNQDSNTSLGIDNLEKLSGDRATLIRDPEYRNGNKKDTFGGKMASYFMSTEEGKNENLWTERFNSIKKDSNKPKVDGFFKDVKGDNETVKKLKEICLNKYQESFPANNSEQEKWEEVWKYCAIPNLTQKPKTIGESDEQNEYSESFSGQNQSLKDKLISTKNGENEHFWAIRNMEFLIRKYNLEMDNKIREEKEKYKFFRSESKKDKQLKDICKEAYGKLSSTNGSSENNPSIDEVSKFCSMEMVRFED